jgi:hypothetical protein
MIADGFNVDPKAAFGLAVTMLTELAYQTCVPLPPRPAPDNSVTFGTRFMLIAPHSPAAASPSRFVTWQSGNDTLASITLD